MKTIENHVYGELNTKPPHAPRVKDEEDFTALLTCCKLSLETIESLTTKRFGEAKTNKKYISQDINEAFNSLNSLKAYTERIQEYLFYIEGKNK